jgi:hypothetical protein
MHIVLLRKGCDTALLENMNKSENNTRRYEIMHTFNLSCSFIILREQNETMDLL